MGRKERFRKEQKIQEKFVVKEEVKRRGKEKFWNIALPIINFSIALITTFILIWGVKVVLAKLPTDEKMTKVEKRAVIETKKGQIEIAFYPGDAPKTVQNFELLAERGYYNGTKFHRVVPDFVIQGGDPLSKDKDPSNDGQGGESAWGGKFADELNPKTASYKAGYKEGVVAMANSGPNTNGSQFFIMLKDTPSLPKKYSMFGHVVSGMDVVHKITQGDVMISVAIINKKVE